MDVATYFGFDPELTDRLADYVDILYTYYWRVAVNGNELIPTQGGGLLVANHSGVLPFDAMMMKMAVYRNPPNRHVWVLMERFVQQLPFINILFRRTGNVLACNENTIKLLTQGELVLVFPEGVKGISKTYDERYRLRRFGRGGFVRTAIEAKVPIIPVAIAGAEEIYKLIYHARWPFKYLGIPYLPITTTFPWLGLLGMIPKPTKWRITILEPRTDHLSITHGPDEDLQAQEIGESIRSSIHSTLLQMLRKRRSLYF